MPDKNELNEEQNEEQNATPEVDAPLADKPLADKPSADKPLAGKPQAETSVAEKPSADKTLGKSAEDSPVLDRARPAYVKSELLSEALSWAKTIVFAVAFALLINNFVIINTSVLSGSMENTIMTDDRVIAFRLSYLFSKPERFDIVVFRYPDDESQLYVKRVIGLPGETIEIRDGKVYINGSETPLRDEFIRDAPEGWFEPFQIPEGEYFMMGDNRIWSIDSRSWINKTVEEKKILGKAIFKYYPGFKNLLGA